MDALVSGCGSGGVELWVRVGVKRCRGVGEWVLAFVLVGVCFCVGRCECVGVGV